MSDTASPVKAPTPGPNKNIPGLVPPQGNIAALTQALRLVVQGMQSLAGQAGSTLNRAVTFQDLINLRLLTAQVASSATGTITTGGGSSSGGGGSGLPVIDVGYLLANIGDVPAQPGGADISGFLDSAVGTQTGLILFRDDSAWTVLDIGSDGEVLTVVEGMPAWQPVSGVEYITIGGSPLTIGGAALYL